MARFTSTIVPAVVLVLATESLGQKVYVVDYTGEALIRFDADGSNEETILTYQDLNDTFVDLRPIYDFLDLTIDSVGGKLYWISKSYADGNLVDYVMRANTDGTNMEIVIAGTPLKRETMRWVNVYRPAAVPAISTWGLFALAALLVGAATILIRGRCGAALSRR